MPNLKFSIYWTKEIYYLLYILSFLGLSLRPAYGQLVCSSNYTEQLQSADPERAQMMEKFYRNALEAVSENTISSRAASDERIYVVPVVVHVVFNDYSENISEEQIKSQIEALNEDFLRLNADTINTPEMFKSVAGVPGIQFCLAKIDPNGNPTTGITRTYTPKRTLTYNEVKFNRTDGKDAWPSDQYLNVWVCNLPIGQGGWGTYPGGDPAYDGIVCDYKVFGRGNYSLLSGYRKGRVMTHEVGHWLGLAHTWGGNQECGDRNADPDCACNIDDGFSDTPNAGSSNFRCETGNISCGSIDMVENYMDYSNDNCKNLFSEEQALFMRAQFRSSGGRSSFRSHCQCYLLNVHIKTVPDNMRFIADGKSYVGRTYFSWEIGSTHILDAPRQNEVNGTRRLFSRWSPRSPNDWEQQMITVECPNNSSSTINYTVYFNRVQHKLSTDVSGDGSLSRNSGWFDEGSEVRLFARPDSNSCYFGTTGSGDGSYTGHENPFVIKMNEPIHQDVSFSSPETHNSVTFDTYPSGYTVFLDGQPLQTPATLCLEIGSEHNILVPDIYDQQINIRKKFLNWSDGGKREHRFNVGSDNQSLIASYQTQFFVNISQTGGGLVFPKSAWQDSGSVVQLNAHINCDQTFKEWRGTGIGSYSGPDSMAEILVLEPISQQAVFISQTAPDYTKLNIPDLERVNDASDWEWIDFDQDGDQDIVAVSNSSTRTWTVLQNNLSTFTQLDIPDLERVNDASDWEWIDFDQDGDQDIVAVSNSSIRTWTVLQNNLSTFTQLDIPDLERVYDAHDWEWIDFDQDGDQDIIAVSNSSTRTWTILQNNLSTFTQLDIPDLERVHDAYDWEWIDFDQDGDQDIVAVSNSSTRTWTILQNNLSTFTQLDIPDLERVHDAYDWEWIDFDQDGDQDIIAVSNSSTRTWTVLQNNLSTFTQLDIPDLERVHDAHDWEWLDFDQDGDQDIVAVSNSSTRTWTILQNNLSTFTQLDIPDLERVYDAHDWEWLDFDQDGDQDIVAVSNSSTRTWTVLQNNLSTFTQLDIPDLERVYDAHDWEWIDFDQDGDQDIVAVPNSSIRTWTILQNNLSTFTQLDIPDLERVYDASDWEWLDFDQDGDQDIVAVSNSSIRTWTVLQNNLSTFTQLDIPDLERVANASDWEWIDFDQDGDQDIVAVSNSSTRAWTVLQNNLSTFTQLDIPDLERVADASDWEWIDFDQDGDQDIIAVSNSSTRTWTVLQNNLSTFTQLDIPDLERVADASDWEWIDFDQDGDQDIIAVSNSSTRTWTVLQNNLSTFTQLDIPDLERVANASDWEWIDFDQDGDQDIVAVSNSLTRTWTILRLDLPCSNNWLKVNLEGYFSVYSDSTVQLELMYRDKIISTDFITQRSGDSIISKLFRLEPTNQVDEVVVTWSSGRKQKLNSIPVDTIIHIIEEDSTLQEDLANKLIISDLKFYPNPAKDWINVDFYLPASGEVRLELYSLTGKRIYFRKDHLDLGLNSLRIPLGELSTGIFVIRLSTDTFQKTEKIMVRK